ncbi:MAG TPA: acyl-CoA dehydrogenase family protein [bacterium]|nr:acyl-CoA dehydrogenase family protein [bacterium]
MSVTDTAKHLTEKEKESLDVAEGARETEWHQPSFVAELFMGKFREDLIAPYPLQSPEDKAIGDEFMGRLESFLKDNLDPDEADRTTFIPQKVLDGLAKMGCWAMKIPKEYGGLGLSQVNYNRAIAQVASYCGSTAVWLSAHQSIGVPQPLKLFGNDAQKHKYFPMFAKGAVSAFALTEPIVGSDPAQMTTTAVPSSDGKSWVINGAKLWCTNGLVADVMVVMARTPPKMVNGKEKKQITAFIVEKGTPGIEYPSRCDFMGIRAIQNGVITFRDVKVPAENMLWGEGQGLKLALITLNTGRLTLPAASAGMSKQALQIARRWGKERVQWGQPIGKHEPGAARISWMAASTFAQEAMTYYTSALVDRGGADIRLEAAMAKLFCSEASWKIVDDLMQLRGGRGYETGPSLRARGEKGYAVERMMRDSRINRIIEGTSEIQHLFIAREALDKHMSLAGDVLNPKAPLGKKLKALVNCAIFYPFWYLRLWLPTSFWPKYSEYGSLAKYMRYVDRTSRKLARTLFHQMVKFGPKLERRQMILGRLVEVGTELFAMATACAKVLALEKAMIQNREAETRAAAAKAVTPPRTQIDNGPRELADIFCRQAQIRICNHFLGVCWNTDVRDGKVAQKAMDGGYEWMEAGIIVDDGEGYKGQKTVSTQPSEERRRYPT